MHCLILGGLDVLKVSARPKRPLYDASQLLKAAILFFCSSSTIAPTDKTQSYMKYLPSLFAGM